MDCCQNDRSRHKVSCIDPNGGCVCVDRDMCASKNFAARGTVGLYNQPAEQLSTKVVTGGQANKTDVDLKQISDYQNQRFVMERFFFKP